jgi:phosphoribosylformylglycinamidine synthase subunit PurQ / glutaminase
LSHPEGVVRRPAGLECVTVSQLANHIVLMPVPSNGEVSAIVRGIMRCEIVHSCRPAASVKTAIVVFPGTNCERDTQHVLTDVLGAQSELVWHQSGDLSGFDAVVLPGGFAHGDHLRAGAIARFSPIMREVERFARSDRPVIGICNGFQVLLEAGLLPGAMLRNASLRFRSVWCSVRVETTSTPLTSSCRVGQVLRLPIAHGEGNYFAPPSLHQQLEQRGQVVFRYCGPDGAIEEAFNPNGSVANIAGLCSEGRNVVAVMPHPERASEAELGGIDGRFLFASLLRSGVPIGAR